MSDRNLRHKTVPVYDDDDLVEDEINGKRTYELKHKLESDVYCANLIDELEDGTSLTFESIQRNGFKKPMRIKNKQGLGMTLPSEEFSVRDVKSLVGSRRKVDVMECKTQQALTMTMRDFESYYSGSERSKIYNVISLEFSRSKLEPYVERPAVVNSMDWIDLAWPPHLKQCQTDQSNNMTGMMYPKVQKYCLMSIAGCYTDFHIDFGGTSVWYHILKGGKVFWMIEPTEENLKMYEKWTMSGNQGEVFLGDLVECQRVELHAGDSLMIPSGWIHSVYTPLDSLVFGGNFLNSFNISMQLKVSQLEARCKVPPKFRFPFYNELSWYVLDRYVHILDGKSFLTAEYKALNHVRTRNTDDERDKRKHLTSYERSGLTELVESLSKLPPTKRFVPTGVAEPDELLEAARVMLEQHADDDDEMAVSGEPIAVWPIVKKIPKLTANKGTRKPRTPLAPGAPRTPSSSGGSVAVKSKSRIRRVRCKQCEACKREDCRECVYCKDMKKFGGPGTMKQTCMKRRCLNPILPNAKPVKEEPVEPAAALAAPSCDEIHSQQPEKGGESKDEVNVADPSMNVNDSINVNLTNGSEGDDHHNHTNIESSPSSGVEDSGIDENGATDKSVNYENGDDVTPETLEYGDDSSEGSDPEDGESGSSSDDDEPKAKRPKLNNPYPCAPPSSPRGKNNVKKRQMPADDSMIGPLTCRVWRRVFSYLDKGDRCALGATCRSMCRVAFDPEQWRSINVSNEKVDRSMLEFLVARQPVKLDLTGCNIMYGQLSWLLQRVDSLRSLNISKNSWAVAVSLMMDSCPLLTALDLSWMSRFDDENFRSLFALPGDVRPGRVMPHCRLSFLQRVNVSGLNIGDASLRLVADRLVHLEVIEMSFTDVTDAGMSYFCQQAPDTLRKIVASSCVDITNQSLISLAALKSLRHLDVTRCGKVDSGKCEWLCEQNGHMKQSEDDPKLLLPIT